TPAVNITASNGGSVNFGTISPKQMNAGEVVSRTFNLGMSVPQDCETGLNISVRFEPNNNTVLGGKYIDMGNGLQTLLTRNSTDISYDEDYNIGEVMPQSPINVPFTATLSKIAGSTIASGPFSKTVRVVVSY
ncbi:fimbrial protein, partial [Providencia rettgeri]|uniref:fimbrial protein n=1 Tax=Providencia rettgeri TaxID=587 RepID=UPI0032DB7047